MTRLIYWVPAVIAFTTALGYIGLSISTTALVSALIVICAAVDLINANIKKTRAGIHKILSALLLFLLATVLVSYLSYLVRSDLVYPTKYQIYALVTAINCLVPLLWLTIFSRKREEEIARVLLKSTRTIFLIDLFFSAIQIYYVTFIDPSGGIFAANQRLNSLEFNDTYRLAGIFQSGQDHGFFLLVCVGLYWAGGNVKSIFGWAVLVFSGVCVYFTYTRTIYLVFSILISTILVFELKAQVAKRKTGPILFIIFLASAILTAYMFVDVLLRYDYSSNAIFNTQTLDSRQGSWAVYQRDLSQNGYSLAFGKLLVQSGFNFMDNSLPLIDNFFYATLLFGGVPFFVGYMVFYACLFVAFARSYVKRRSFLNTRLAVLGMLLVVSIFVAGYATPIWDNYTNGLFGGLVLVSALNMNMKRNSKEKIA